MTINFHTIIPEKELYYKILDFIYNRRFNKIGSEKDTVEVKYCELKNLCKNKGEEEKIVEYLKNIKDKNIFEIINDEQINKDRQLEDEFIIKINCDADVIRDYLIDLIGREQKHWNFLNTPKDNIRKIIPIDLPEGTKWENITINFINGNDTAITLSNNPDFKCETDYKNMGFEDKRKHNPNRQWRVLSKMAEYRGEVTSDNYDSEFINMKKTKSLLSQSLKTYFKIDDDPFFNYRKEKAYKIKINLQIGGRRDYLPNIDEEENDLLGINESYNKIAPIIPK